MIQFKINSVEFYRSFFLLDMMEYFFVMCPPGHLLQAVLEVKPVKSSSSVVYLYWGVVYLYSHFVHKLVLT